MIQEKVPILLSFHAITHLGNSLIFGQLTYTTVSDLTFKDYSRRKTFRTLFSLYRTKPYANQEINIKFDNGSEVLVKTDTYGSFYQKLKLEITGASLQQVVLTSGEEVKITGGLFPASVMEVQSDIIVVSDIDDTLLHSFIYRKILKFRTLMFTRLEKRKAVVNMQELLKKFTDQGSACFYLSNSEQNLYPMIYRFLMHNQFPQGPLFLKKLRGLWDVLRNIKFPILNVHKQQTLEDILSLFPDKKFVLMGDNTQYDLPIYLNAAEKFSGNIRYIIIRKVIDKAGDESLIKAFVGRPEATRTILYYADNFPYSFQFG